MVSNNGQAIIDHQPADDDDHDDDDANPMTDQIGSLITYRITPKPKADATLAQSHRKPPNAAERSATWLGGRGALKGEGAGRGSQGYTYNVKKATKAIRRFDQGGKHRLGHNAPAFTAATPTWIRTEEQEWGTTRLLGTNPCRPGRVQPDDPRKIHGRRSTAIRLKAKVHPETST